MGVVFWSRATAADVAWLVVLTGAVVFGGGLALVTLTRAGTDRHDAIQMGLGLMAAGVVLVAIGIWWRVRIWRTTPRVRGLAAGREAATSFPPK